MIEALATKLVQTAPDLDDGDVADLIDALHAHGSVLALAIARVVELVADQLVDAGVALPALAEACATLCDARSDARALAAAKYRVDTLVPRPQIERAPAGGAARAADASESTIVPLASLVRPRRT